MKLLLGDRLDVYVGRDWSRMLTASVFVGIGRQENPKPYDYAWRMWVSASWNWLPEPSVFARVIGDGWFAIDSSLWTGREYRVVKWRWPHSFHYGMSGLRAKRDSGEAA